jgi:type IV pilus assembly protein PilC
MPSFRYIASANGDRREGILQAASTSEAAAALRRQGLMILALNETHKNARSDVQSGDGFLPRSVARFLILRIHIEIALNQLSTLLAGGVPIMTALKTVEGLVPGPLRRVVAAIARHVQGGEPLSKGMKAEAPFLGETTLGLVAAGEANGTVAEMLGQASSLMQRVREVRSRIVQAFSYPAIVTLGAIAVAVYMVQVVFPKVLKFIEGQRSNVELPAISSALIVISRFMTDYGLYLLLAPLALGIAFHLLRRTERGGLAIDRALLSVPLLGGALRAAGNAMWTRVLGTLVRSGIDIVSAIDFVERTVKNRHYRKQFRQVRHMLRRGRSLSDAVRSTDLERLCPLAPAFVSVGERTGGLDDGLLQVATDSEARLERRTDLLAKLVEPAVFIVVGGMVGFVYFGFFLAMLAATRSAG